MYSPASCSNAHHASGIARSRAPFAILGSLGMSGVDDGSVVGEAVTKVVGDGVADDAIQMLAGLLRFALNKLVADIEDKFGVEGDARERETG